MWAAEWTINMKRIKNTICIGIAFALLLVTVSCSRKVPAPDFVRERGLAGGNYNIIFITTDQERYFDEYPEGSDYKARQRLEDLGTTFEKHYICSNVSSPSRTVMYTGRHIPETGVHDNIDFALLQSPMNDVKTIGHMMRELNYYTAFKGKSHFVNFTTGFNPMNPNSAMFADGADRGPPPQMQDALEPFGFSDWNPDGDYGGEINQGYTTDPVITSTSIQWLRSTGAIVNEEDQPFFLAINLINPHDIMYGAVGEQVNDEIQTGFPITGPPDTGLYAKTYPNVPLPPGCLEAHSRENLPASYFEFISVSDRAFGPAPATGEDWRKYQDFYFNTIQDNDNNLLLILDELENLGMMTNTIIIFTSDHGEMHGAHNLRGKGGFIYDYNLNVPLVIVHPEYEGGQRVKSVTSHFDLVPTFVDFTSASDAEKTRVLGGVRGHSLVPLLKDPATSVRDGALFIFSSLTMTDSGGGVSRMTCADGEERIVYRLDMSKRGMARTVIGERYKFARYFAPNNFHMPATYEELISNNDLELYDLHTDPDEMINLASPANREANKDLIMQLNDKLNRLIIDEFDRDDGREFDNMPQYGGFDAMLAGDY